ncbi:hypothetical protein SJ05684_c21740 [Sinorhizobium sojae CCBAU 05684]|uniref:Uncharacterized protein n=1 Tax=Sinorhizobium sojae CCBAU 05684 TaxID=716928 RepID=A0A249PCW9_9HYPH|nr:hypothetical protein [Sinorhizobium sojae]ASY63615.1 hypothetical protein SJ05684_c21740 [Sinorhizobium sojae CCBAU 05684]
MAGYITYRNQGATRNLPISEDLLKRLKYLEEMGLTAEVFSGGQPEKGSGLARIGSTRHDHGNAADVHFFRDGKRLDWANEQDRPIFEEIVRRGKSAGLTGFGAGPGYMQPGSMHIGMGTPGVWGAGGKSDNAPDWLRAAYEGAPSAKPDVVSEVVAAANKPEPAPMQINTAPAQAPFQAQAKAKAEEPKSRNGILVQAYNKLTGSNVQVPDKIFGIETDNINKGFAGLGDFAETLAENDQAINNQIQSAARTAQANRNSAPVELQMLGSYQPMSRKKKKGALSGLGGYFV